MAEDHVSLTPRVCMAELMSASPVRLPGAAREAFLADLRAYFGALTVLRTEDTALHLALDEFPVQYEGGESVPAQIVLLSSDDPGMKPDSGKARETLEASLAQTWNWPDVEEVAETSPHTLLVMDIMSTALDPGRRMHIFPRVLHSLLGYVPCAALHFPNSQCVVDPEEYKVSLPGDPDGYPLHGLLNVRYFSVQDTAGEIVMDTLGLHVFGLPDVQCHCAGVDPRELGGWLYSLGAYIAASKNGIGDGDTVDAFNGTRMTMTYEEALVAPRRVVLDLQPTEDT